MRSHERKTQLEKKNLEPVLLILSESRKVQPTCTVLINIDTNEKRLVSISYLILYYFQFVPPQIFLENFF